MKTIKEIGAQGDCLLRRVKQLPDNAKAVPPSATAVVAHSETGHHHIAETGGEYLQLFTTSDPLVSYLKVTAPHVDIVHHRPWDTHETLRLLSGGEGETIWEIRRQREYTPEGWRIVAD